MDPDSTSPLLVAAEVTAWAIPSLLALLLARRCGPGERRPWLFISAVCSVFALDELLDLLGRGHRLLQHVARFLDPGSFRGDTLIWRIVLLGLGGLAGIATMAYLFRGGQPTGRAQLPRWVAFSGVCLVVCYLLVRFIPSLRELMEGPVGWGTLGLAWCLLVGGAVLEFERLRDRE